MAMLSEKLPDLKWPPRLISLDSELAVGVTVYNQTSLMRSFSW
jgi:hypothetical protein